MNILALETSMGMCGAAVLRGGNNRRLFVSETRMSRGHAEALMPMVADVMQEAGLDFAAIDLVAASLGPGSFTGVRVAIAAARGLALATGAKLWGTDSLSVMARTALLEGALPTPAPFAIAADARAEMVYLAVFDARGARRDGPLLLPVSDAAHALPRDVQSVFGSGAGLLADAARKDGRSMGASLPDLEPGVVALAELARESGESLPSLRPLYLRPPDAKPQGKAEVMRR